MPHESSRAYERLVHRAGMSTGGTRILAEEVPIALSYHGTTHAVMMATPADLEDFALGFSFGERIIQTVSDVQNLDIVEHERGIDLQIRLADIARERLVVRRRVLAGPVGCGLCGVESIDDALRPVPPVASGISLAGEDIGLAVSSLSRFQPMNRETRAAHAAAFWMPGQGIVVAREDVGRHNALDKLAGALLQSQIDAAKGAIVLTSRVSVELVQKAAMIGAGIIVAVSAPTGLAVRVAEAANITLVGIARDDDYEVFTHAWRIKTGAFAHVA